MRLGLDFGLLVDKQLSDYLTQNIVPSPFVRKVVEHHINGFQQGLFILTSPARYRLTAAFKNPERIETLLERDWEDPKAWNFDDLTKDQRIAFFDWLRIECLTHLSHAISHDDPPYIPEEN